MVHSFQEHLPRATQGTSSEKTQFLPYREQLGAPGELLRNADVQAPPPVIQVLRDSESSKKVEARPDKKRNLETEARQAILTEKLGLQRLSVASWHKGGKDLHQPSPRHGPALDYC